MFWRAAEDRPHIVVLGQHGPHFVQVLHAGEGRECYRTTMDGATQEEQ